MRLSGSCLNVRLSNFGLSGANKNFLGQLLVISAALSTNVFSDAVDAFDPQDSEVCFSLSY